MEYGHLVIESRHDRNITFRTRGQGSVNVVTDAGLFGLNDGMAALGDDVLARLHVLETFMSSGSARDNRMSALEGRVQEIEV